MFVLQVAVILLSIGECHDDPLTLKIQELTLRILEGSNWSKGDSRAWEFAFGMQKNLGSGQQEVSQIR